MPYPAAHRKEIRARIVESARRLFNRHGFDNVSVKQIMAGAGLTHGGFYNYFKGKSSLYIEVPKLGESLGGYRRRSHFQGFRRSDRARIPVAPTLRRHREFLSDGRASHRS
jgi:AcrR family transcriptional regulator